MKKTPVHYSARYRDEFGEETTIIENDGDTLSVILREVTFTGSDFHDLHISENAPSSKRRLFNLSPDDALCGYLLDFDIPVWCTSQEGTSEAILHIHVELAKLGEDNHIVNEVLLLTIEYQEKMYKSDGKNLYSTFDEQLTALTSNLPDEIYLKVCWNCAFADYFPGGSGMFGNLACFRDIKDDYRKVKDKKTLMDLWDKYTDDVQEIDLCPEFEKRPPGIGGLNVG